MRIALVHNPTAGDRLYDGEELRRLFTDAGHDVVEVDRSKRAIRGAMDSRPDAFAVAGGDGTVAKVAKAVSNAGIPLVVLPAGTSNNIALSLGVSSDAAEIVRTFSTGRRVRLDVGKITAPWGRSSFVEGAGVGFVGAALRAGGSLRARLERSIRNRSLSGEERTRAAAVGFARLIREQPSRFYAVRADGETVDGEYLAVEAMIIRAIGPRIALAPNADPGDGSIDLVLAGPDHRSALADYVESFGDVELPPIEIRRVTEAKVSWSASEGHVDDEPWPADQHGSRAGDPGHCARMSIAGSVEVLLPEA